MRSKADPFSHWRYFQNTFRALTIVAIGISSFSGHALAENTTNKLQQRVGNLGIVIQLKDNQILAEQKNASNKTPQAFENYFDRKVIRSIAKKYGVELKFSKKREALSLYTLLANTRTIKKNNKFGNLFQSKSRETNQSDPGSQKISLTMSANLINPKLFLNKINESNRNGEAKNISQLILGSGINFQRPGSGSGRIVAITPQKTKKAAAIASEAAEFDSGIKIFTSSTKVKVANLGSLAGADRFCQNLASQAGHAGTFVALMSDSKDSALTRVKINHHVYNFIGQKITQLPYAPNSSMSAHNIFWAGELNGVLHIDEKGRTIVADNSMGVSVWSGSTKSGTVQANSSCDDWKSSDSNKSASIGISDYNFSGYWLNSLGAPGLPAVSNSCSGDNRVICIEQRADAPTATPTRSATATPVFDQDNVLTMFTTADVVRVDQMNGTAGADRICQNAAQSANLKGRFVAFLSDDDNDLGTRIKLNKQVHTTNKRHLSKQPDGDWPWEFTPEEMFSGGFLYGGAPDVDQFGKVIDLGPGERVLVWTASKFGGSPDQPFLLRGNRIAVYGFPYGLSPVACSNWTSNGRGAILNVGNAKSNFYHWLVSDLITHKNRLPEYPNRPEGACITEDNRLYCIRQDSSIATATPSPTNTAINTQIPATSTPTNFPTVLASTPSPVPPTRTFTPVPPTQTATKTNTAVPPTQTSTPIPPTRTFTPVPPTQTATKTNTPAPPTQTATQTFTPVPPTATKTNTPTPTSGAGYIFITSKYFTGNIKDQSNLSALEQADKECYDLAPKNLDLKWQAVLSSSAVDVKDRFSGFDGPVFNNQTDLMTKETISRRVVSNLSKLWVGNSQEITRPILENSIKYDEKGELVIPNTFWSGSINGGVKDNRSYTGFCLDWTSNNPSYRAEFGNREHLAISWLSSLAGNANIYGAGCNEARPIACLGIPSSSYVPPTATPSVTSTFTATATPTHTPQIFCTPVRCDYPGRLVCPNGNCPNGCGYTCEQPTPTFTPTNVPPTATNTPQAMCTAVRCDAPGRLVCQSGNCPNGCGYTCQQPTPTYTPTNLPPTATVTSTPVIMCTPVRCDAPGRLVCPSGNCPNGCGYTCQQPTPTITPTATPTIRIVSENTLRVFQTSQTLAGSFGSLAVADQFCRDLAWGANLGGQDWKAILSTANTSARSRLEINGPVIDLSGKRIASNADDLWDGSIEDVIKVNERGQLNNYMNYLVWTGTLADGTADVRQKNSSCNNWTTLQAAAETGRTDRKDKGWIAIYNDSDGAGNSCSNQGSFYCLEQRKYFSDISTYPILTNEERSRLTESFRANIETINNSYPALVFNFDSSYLQTKIDYFSLRMVVDSPNKQGQVVVSWLTPATYSQQRIRSFYDLHKSKRFIGMLTAHSKGVSWEIATFDLYGINSSLSAQNKTTFSNLSNKNINIFLKRHKRTKAEIKKLKKIFRLHLISKLR